MPTTPDILLRLIRAAPLPTIGTPESVGVDDFALHKGRVYAGLIVDHDARRPLDVLPDCAPATIAAWLAAHPSIRLVRDGKTVFDARRERLDATIDVLAAKVEEIVTGAGYRDYLRLLAKFHSYSANNVALILANLAVTYPAHICSEGGEPLSSPIGTRHNV